ncbi:MAG: alpha/beta hydrolase [Gammaproteobacteria bacterium]|nr:alpha/beta hydrolase [Gammaproteobacteria bacterium]
MQAGEYSAIGFNDIHDLTPHVFLYEWQVCEHITQLRWLLESIGHQDLEGKSDEALAEIAISSLQQCLLYIAAQPGVEQPLHQWLVSSADFAGMQFNAQAMIAAAKEAEQRPPPPVADKQPRIAHLRWSESRKPLGMPVNLIFSAQNFVAGDVATVTIYQTPKNGEKQKLTTLEHTLMRASESCSLTWHVQALTNGDDVLCEQPPENLVPVYFVFVVEINGQCSEVSDPLYTSTYFEYTIIGPHELPICVDDSSATLHDKGKQQHKRWRDQGTDFVRVPLHESKIESWYEIHKTQLCDAEDNVLAEQQHPIGFETPFILPVSCKSHYRVKSQALFPQVIVNLREDASKGDPNRRHLLSDAEIEYFKANGNNATVFVHGFNVKYGVSARQVESVEIKKESYTSHKDGYSVDLGYRINVRHAGKQARTTCIDQQYLSEHFHPDFAKDEIYWQIDDDQINGSAAHSWFVHMEHELNLAANGGDEIDWDKYTRIINVAWSGDVNPVEYIEAEFRATSAGVRLSLLLEQLVSEGIRINIIAHSLANRVVLTAFNLLGEKGIEEKIDHHFMWQPAVPDTVLSNDPEADSSVLRNWKMIHAHKAAKKFVVLYTAHDNVLGGHPAGGFKEDITGGNDHLIKLEEALGGQLSGAYTIATIIGIPGGRFFMPWHRADRNQRRIQNLLSDHGKQVSEELKEALKRYEDGIPMDELKPHWYDILCSYFYQRRVEGRVLDDLITIRNELEEKGIEVKKPRPALGWAGIKNAVDIDESIRAMFLAGKIIEVDQGKWLYSHSGMKIPTKDLREYVYRNEILDRMKIQSGFGTY